MLGAPALDPDRGPGPRGPAPEGPGPAGRRAGPAGRDRPGARGRLAGLAAVVWVVLVGLASLAPALAHGPELGSFRVTRNFGMEAHVGLPAPYNPVASDQVQQTAPWVALDWTEVHEGHLPLWNPYSAMGTPLLFDFQSAGLSLPAIVSYAFPRRLSYDVLVIVKLLIAGTGLLFAARVMRLRWSAGALAASIGELSGSFSGWLGWPMDGVACWTGWVLGAGLLLAEGRRRRIALPLLAFSLAGAVYGGHPELLVITAVAVTVPVLVTLVASAWRHGHRALLGRLAGLSGAALAGAALGMPLLLPGAQLLGGSVHVSRHPYYGLPVATAVNLVFSGWSGYPLRGSEYFGFADYYETAAFVGLAALALVVLGLLRGWRRPGVAGLGLTAVLLGAIVWWGRMARLIDALPGIRLILWSRSLIPLDLLLGLLAGVGLDVVLDAVGIRPAALRQLDGRASGDRTGGPPSGEPVPGGGHRRPRHEAQRRTTAWCFAGLAVAAAGVLAVFGYHEAVAPPPGLAATIRDRSFVWPAAQAAALLLAAATLVRSTRQRSRGARRGRVRSQVLAATGVFLVVVTEIGFLLLGTPELWGSSTTGFHPTPAVTRLATIVGDQRVGFDCPDATQFADLGILPEANAAYGIAEAEMYDAILPLRYLSIYARLSRTPVAPPNSGNFCVPVTSAAIARDYGIEYLLKASGVAAPPGAVAVGTVGDEELWRVPGASVVTLQPIRAPLDDPAATAVGLSEADPARLSLHLDPPTASRLELHIGDFPGWSARIGGRRLPLRSLFGDELQATVPAGVHTVVVTYRPRRWVEGTWAAIAALVALALFALVETRRTLRSHRAPSAGQPGRPGGPT